MIKYSGSYANTEKNFVFLNINKQKRVQDSTLYGLFCVVQNIILRGMVSIPSDYLKQQLGKLGTVQEPCFLSSKDFSKWNLIKGDTENVDYPAEVFFEKLLPKYLGEYKFVKNLIVPEAEFSDVLGYSTALDGQQVDFYIPQTKTTIEIDGSSHDVSGQKYKDSIRDEALRKENIKVIRMTTGDLRKETDKFKKLMEELVSDIKSSEVINKYVKNKDIATVDIRVQYDAVLRLQMFLLENFKSGRFDIRTESININIVDSDISEIEKLIEIAYEDLKHWSKAIAQLLKYNIRFPELIVNSSKTVKSLDLDFSMFKRYTDMTVSDRNTVYVRNDYYCDRNYYKVATADTLQYSFPVETESKDNDALAFILKNIFGFGEFNVGQLPIIKNTLERNDTIGILPTGGGKSLTYQICALLQPGVTVVIVPIVSLMQDQKRGMDLRHLDRTSYLSSGQKGDMKSRIIDDFMGGKFQLIWSSPERFQNEEFREALTHINEKMNFALAVIDEVHCLSEWGHDFRVSYLALVNTLRKYCPEACLLGLTATASQAVLEDLKAEFENDGSGIKALTSMDRDELVFERITVQSEKEKEEKIAELVKENVKEYTNLDGTEQQQIGLIFCPTVNGKQSSCNKVKAELDNEKVSEKVASYHGQMSTDVRTQVQEEFMADKYDVMVCTKAFGMGIDKGNVKYTIHSCLPQSVESFYQEAGRAGREKDKSVKSNCYVVYSPENKEIQIDVEKIFSPDTGIDERKELSTKLQNDLSTIMFFWNNNRKTVEEEYANISTVLKKLFKGASTIHFDDTKENKNMSLENIQAALYKLSLLGVVENWTIQYASFEQGSVEVEYLGLDENKMLRRLLAYIHKYDTEFRIDTDTTRYHKYYKMVNVENEKIITKYIKLLINWGNENVLYNRLQSTYTMLQWMDPKVSDVQFRRNIVEYFKFSERSVIYEGIIYNPIQYETWFDLLYSKDVVTNRRTDPINEEMAEANLASLQRYLESYRNNTGLNFLSGFLRIFVGKYTGTEGEWRFKEALQNIKESLSKEQQEEVIEMTLDVGKSMRLDNKDLLSKELLGYFGGYERKIFDRLEDRYSLSILLEEPVSKVETMVKESL